MTLMVFLCHSLRCLLTTRMNVLKYSLMAAALLLLAQETLAHNACAIACEYGSLMSSTSDNSMFFCSPKGGECTVTDLIDAVSFSSWTDFDSMSMSKIECGDGESVGLCSYGKTWQLDMTCSEAGEAVGFCIVDYQRRRSGKARRRVSQSFRKDLRWKLK